jgi:hypothetical protein
MPAPVRACWARQQLRPVPGPWSQRNIM